MAIQSLQQLFSRDLNKLRSEIEAYQNESNIWIVDQNISNSAGNLTLHLIGNLNTYIGAEIGKTGYLRNRELEFSAKDIAKAELINMINATIHTVQKSLDLLKEEDLASEYPILVFKEKTTMEYMLIHLATHLAYHLGQVNYHRRLLDK